MNNKEVLFPFYSGHIKLTKVLGYVSLHSFIESHKKPTLEMFELFRQIKIVKDPKRKRILKQKLYSFTPSVIIQKGLKRRYSNVKRFTGLMQIDLDKIPDKQMASELKQWCFEQPECVTTYHSPSGDVKSLIRIKECSSPEQYRKVHKSVSRKYEETGCFDMATKNAVLPLFLSFDKDILFRDFSKALPWEKEESIETTRKNLNNQTPTSYYGDNSKRTVRILRNKINSIVDNGHPQVRSASLILGSRAAAGYIDKQDAISEITILIQCNSYLQKGVDGYIETAVWGIEQGFKTPKYY